MSSDILFFPTISPINQKMFKMQSYKKDLSYRNPIIKMLIFCWQVNLQINCFSSKENWPIGNPSANHSFYSAIFSPIPNSAQYIQYNKMLYSMQYVYLDPACWKAQSRTRKQPAPYLCFEKKQGRNTKTPTKTPIKDKGITEDRGRGVWIPKWPLGTEDL